MKKISTQSNKNTTAGTRLDKEIRFLGAGLEGLDTLYKIVQRAGKGLDANPEVSKGRDKFLDIMSGTLNDLEEDFDHVLELLDSVRKEFPISSK